MKLKLSIFIGVVLCMLLMGVYGVLSRMFDSRDGWCPNDMYSTVGGATYSTVSYSAGSSVSDVPVVSMRGGRSFSRRAAAPAFSYAPVSTPAYNLSPIAGTASYGQSPISYAASSATVKSFGGGGNVASSVSGGAAGSAASSVAAASVAAPAGLSVSMPSTSAYAYNTNRNTRSNAGDLSTLMSGEIAAASSYAGIGNTTGGASRGIGGRRNAPGMGGNLDNWIQDIIGNDGWVWSDGTIDYFDKEKLYQMYLDAIANGQLPEGITWEDFLSWFGDQSSRYAFPIPSGVWFMCFLALGYGVYIAYRRKQKVVNS